MPPLVSLSGDGGRGAFEMSNPAALQEPEGPQPQPELREPRLEDPSLKDLSARDYAAIVKRAAKEALDDNLTDAAAAIAYYVFLALPATLLVSLGAFSLIAGRDSVDTLLEKLSGIVPSETITLLRDSLTRVVENQSGGIAMVAVGAALAVWTTTGAMTAFMRALNRVYERKETRGFVRQRGTALVMIALSLIAFGLVFGLLILGPHLSRWVGDAVGLASEVAWIWWAAQWPILILGLFAVFAAVHYLGPNVDHPRLAFLTPGSLFAVVAWLAVSGLFALYVSMFGSYNKVWGSLAAVIIMLTWLWLSALALLIGAEINAEAERSRELRRGEPAERELQAPAKA
jgi:membrane protein